MHSHLRTNSISFKYWVLRTDCVASTKVRSVHSDIVYIQYVNTNCDSVDFITKHSDVSVQKDKLTELIVLYCVDIELFLSKM